MAARGLHRRSAWWVLTACVVAAIAAPETRAAWTPAQLVSPSMATSEQLDVAVNDAGDIVAAWRRGDGLTHRVEYRVRHGSSWSAAAFASPAGSEVEDPHVAVDHQGDALFVWRRIVGGTGSIEARALSATGELGAVRRVSMPDQDAAEPRIALDGAGDAVIAWRRSDGLTTRIQARDWAPGGAVGPIATLSAAGLSAS